MEGEGKAESKLRISSLKEDKYGFLNGIGERGWFRKVFKVSTGCKVSRVSSGL